MSETNEKMWILTKKEANQLRLTASEIVYRLWRAGHENQICLLQVHVERSLEEPYSKETSPQSQSRDSTKEMNE